MDIYYVVLEEGSNKMEATITISANCAYQIELMSKHVTLSDDRIEFGNIRGIESLSPVQLKLTTHDSKNWCFTTDKMKCDDLLSVITHAVSSLATVFPTVPLEKLFFDIDVRPPQRLEVLRNAHQLAVKAANLAIDEEECTNGIISVHTFSLKKFNITSNSNTCRLLSAVRYSTWFTTFNADQVKLTLDVLNQILNILQVNSTLEEIDLSNTALEPTHVQDIAKAIEQNKFCRIRSINLSRNQLKRAGLEPLCNAISQLKNGLSKLVLEDSGIKISWANELLFPVLNKAPLNMKTLRFLNLGGLKRLGQNAGRVVGPIQNIMLFLELKNALEELDLSEGGMDLTTLLTSINSGCQQTLRSLNLSGNGYNDGLAEQPKPVWKDFFMKAHTLKCVKLSRTKLPLTVLRELLDGISCNKYLGESGKGIYLDISQNNLGSEGKNTLGNFFRSLVNIHSLDLTNNGLENELTHILANLSHNQSVKHLSIGQNFQFRRPALKDPTLTALTHLMRSATSALESLDLANSSLGGDTSKILTALRNNTKIKKLNISGNCTINTLADDIAHVLQDRTTGLTWISFDCKSFNASGLGKIANAIEKSPGTLYIAIDTNTVTRPFGEGTSEAQRLRNIILKHNKVWDAQLPKDESTPVEISSETAPWPAQDTETTNKTIGTGKLHVTSAFFNKKERKDETGSHSENIGGIAQQTRSPKYGSHIPITNVLPSSPLGQERSTSSLSPQTSQGLGGINTAFVAPVSQRIKNWPPTANAPADDGTLDIIESSGTVEQPAPSQGQNNNASSTQASQGISGALFAQGPRTLPTSSALENFKFHFDAAMILLNTEIELSSYRLQRDNCLVARPRKLEYHRALQQRLNTLLEQYGVKGLVTLDVKSQPVVAKFCHILDSGNRYQNVGMYVEERGAVHWLSTAHGILHDVRDIGNIANIIQRLHNGDIGPVGFFNQMPIDGRARGQHFRMPTPYVCFSAKGCPLSNDQVLYHGIDIALGPMTWLLNEERNSEFPVASISRRTFNLLSADIFDINPTTVQGGQYFNAEELKDKQLESYSWVTNEVLEGSVCEVNYNVLYDLSNFGVVNEIFKNAMLVKPTIKVVPRNGHSGSVWIIKNHEKDTKAKLQGNKKAVAITTATYEEDGVKYWVVSLLCPSLLALKRSYPNIFPDAHGFRGVGLCRP